MAKRRVSVAPWQLTPTEPPATLTESLTTGGRAGAGVDGEGACALDADGRGVGRLAVPSGVGRAEVGAGAALVGVVRDGWGRLEWVEDVTGDDLDGVAEVAPPVVGSGLVRGMVWVSSGRAPSVR